MNALHLARSAYANPASVQSPQTTEYQAFATITQKIKALSENTDSKFSDLATALSENRKLWTILAVDVADPGNRLPQSLRARIFYLAEFTEHHTRKILRGEADAVPLIDINSAIMAGLRAQVEQK